MPRLDLFAENVRDLVRTGEAQAVAVERERTELIARREQLASGRDAAKRATATALEAFTGTQRGERAAVDAHAATTKRAEDARLDAATSDGYAAIRRWTFRRRLPWLAGAGGLAAASLASAAIIWAFGAAFSEPQSVAQSALGAVLAPVAALLTAFTDLLRARFLDPAWLTALVVIALAGGAGTWLLDREARPGELVGTA